MCILICDCRLIFARTRPLVSFHWRSSVQGFLLKMWLLLSTKFIPWDGHTHELSVLMWWFATNGNWKEYVIIFPCAKPWDCPLLKIIGNRYSAVSWRFDSDVRCHSTLTSVTKGRLHFSFLVCQQSLKLVLSLARRVVLWFVHFSSFHRPNIFTLHFDQLRLESLPFTKTSVNLCQSFSLALDAHCLLEVYDVLKEWMLESRLRVNMEPALVLSWLQPKKEKQRY